MSSSSTNSSPLSTASRFGYAAYNNLSKVRQFENLRPIPAMPYIELSQTPTPTFEWTSSRQNSVTLTNFRLILEGEIAEELTNDLRATCPPEFAVPQVSRHSAEIELSAQRRVHILDMLPTHALDILEKHGYLVVAVTHITLGERSNMHVKNWTLHKVKF